MLARVRYLFNSEKGFTLIELMLVIAVLGTLAGIAVPRMGGILDRADKAEVKADFSMIRNALEMYRIEDENREYPATDGDGAPDADLGEYGLSQSVINKFDSTDGEAVYEYTTSEVDGDRVEYTVETINNLSDFNIKLTQDGIEE